MGPARHGRRWEPKIVELRAEDIEAITVEAPTRRLPKRHKQGNLLDDAAVVAESALNDGEA
jgi:hypothetical protein